MVSETVSWTLMSIAQTVSWTLYWEESLELPPDLFTTRLSDSRRPHQAVPSWVQLRHSSHLPQSWVGLGIVTYQYSVTYGGHAGLLSVKHPQLTQVLPSPPCPKMLQHLALISPTAPKTA